MATTTLLTAEEFLAFPETLHKPELVQGEVIEMAPVGGYHSDTQRKLAMLMGMHVDRGNYGALVVELGFRLAAAPDTVRAPDVSFISAEQLRTTPLSAGFYPGYPDIAAEVISPGDTVTQLDAKVQDYLDAGTPPGVGGQPRHPQRRGVFPRRADTDTRCRRRAHRRRGAPRP